MILNNKLNKPQNNKKVQFFSVYYLILIVLLSLVLLNMFFNLKKYGISQKIYDVQSFQK